MLQCAFQEEEEEGQESEGAEAASASAASEGIRVFSQRRHPLKLGPQPISCTTAVFEGKLLADPTDEEEQLASALVITFLIVINICEINVFFPLFER